MPGIGLAEQKPSEIAKLNTLLEAHFNAKIPGVKIRFDEPDPANPPTNTTFHLFLYLIHEDLNIRHSSGRQYDADAKKYLPEDAYVRCLYLVTYWSSKNSTNYDSPAALADSEGVQNLNSMIRALLALRKEPAFRPYQLRVIEPEALNSLGNFWQALDNKPRTIINFAVTLPISLDYEPEQTPQVLSSEVLLEQLEGGWQLMLEQQLYAKLQQATNPGELARVTLRVELAPLKTKSAKVQQDEQSLRLTLSGMAFSDVVAILVREVEGWKTNGLPAEFASRWTVTEVDSEQLKSIARPA